MTLFEKLDLLNITLTGLVAADLGLHEARGELFWTARAERHAIQLLVLASRFRIFLDLLGQKIRVMNSVQYLIEFLHF